jgi:peptide/nickel transport system substrate-binding protein
LFCGAGPLLLLVVTACSREVDPAYSRGSTVTVVYDEDWFDPEEDVQGKFLTSVSLTALNEKGELEGRLAHRWEHSPDYREWTYHLRPGVRWHDGVPVTARDITFSVDLWKDPDVLHYYTAFVEGAWAVDDSTVKIRYTTSADQSIASYLTFYPKHVVEKLDRKTFRTWAFWTHPVGNGPYRFVRYAPHTMMVLEANPDHYRGKPRIERVILKFSGEAGLSELMSGAVDAVTYTNPLEVPKLAGDPRFVVYYSPESYRGFALYWRNDHPLFRDPVVRRALTMAINRRELLRALNLPDDVPIMDGPFTDRQLRRGELPEPLPYDIAQARALLDGAGWRDRDGDGVRERGDTGFQFTALVVGWARGGTAVLVQEQLRQAGVQMELQPMEPGQAMERLRAGQFEAAFATYDNNPGSLQRIRLGAGAPLGYENAEVVQLVTQAAATAVPDEVDRIYRRMTEILQADLPMTFLFPRVWVVFAHRRLRGLSSPWRADPVWFMEELWLAGELSRE